MGGTSQPWMGSQQPQPTPDQIAAVQPNPQPATAGYSTDIASGYPSPYPINSPVAPGSVGDLENRAAVAPGQLGQSLQNQQQPSPQPGQWSDNNPFGAIAKDYLQRWQQAQPQPATGGAIKRTLTNFFSGVAHGMLPVTQTPEFQRQQLLQNAPTSANYAQQWEAEQGRQRYQNVLADRLQQETDFQRQLEPFQLQSLRQGVEQGAQNIQTIRPSFTAADLASLGMPDSVAMQFGGKPLSEADMGVVRQLAAANQKQTLDYGSDGQGQGKGIWLVDKQFNPIKQLSPISETSRSTSLARQQMQMQLMQTQSGQTGIDIVEGRLDPSQISQRSPQYPYILQSANNYSQQVYNQPFDFAKASADYSYFKNPTTQNTLKMINAMTDPGGSIEIAQNAARNLPRFNSTIANQVFNAAATQFGSAEASNFHTAMLGLADEYSKVMGGGVSSDTGRQQGLDLLKAAYSKGQLSGAIDIMRKDITARKSALIGNNTYLQRQYSPRAAGAASLTQPTSAAGFNWNSFPVATGVQ